jgi:hypothetical protein
MRPPGGLTVAMSRYANAPARHHDAEHKEMAGTAITAATPAPARSAETRAVQYRRSGHCRIPPAPRSTLNSEDHLPDDFMKPESFSADSCGQLRISRAASRPTVPVRPHRHPRHHGRRARRAKHSTAAADTDRRANNGSHRPPRRPHSIGPHDPALRNSGCSARPRREPRAQAVKRTSRSPSPSALRIGGRGCAREVGSPN